jgi:hypothetical protein
MSELLPKIARIARLLPQEDGRSDHANAAPRLQKTDVAVTQPLSFPLYTKIPASGERVNWKVQGGFPSTYFASHSITFKDENTVRNTAAEPTNSHNALVAKDQFYFASPVPRGKISQQALSILKAKQFFEEN